MGNGINKIQETILIIVATLVMQDMVLHYSINFKRKGISSHSKSNSEKSFN